MASQAPEQAAGQAADAAVDHKQHAPAEAAVAPAEPTRGDVVKPTSWEEIGVGSLVLATTGPDDGWWESVVVSLKDELLTLKWRDFPKERLFARRRTELALLPPSR